MLVETTLLTLAGRGPEAEALVHMRTYQEEVTEALEATGLADTKGGAGRRRQGRCEVIAIVFLLILVGLMVVFSLMGVGPGNTLIWESLLLVGLFCLFFGAGIYMAAALGVLGLIVGFAFSDRPFWTFLRGQTVWSPSSSFVLVAVPLFLLMGEILLRAGLSDGSIAHSTSGSTGCRAACCAPTSRRAACSRRSRAHRSRPPLTHGLGRAAVLSGHALRQQDGARLARGWRRRSTLSIARHHLHHLRADHREPPSRSFYIAAVRPSLLVVALFTLVIFAKARTAAPADPNRSSLHDAGKAARPLSA